MADKYDRFKTIPSRDLKVGMYVYDVGRSWLRHPWIKKRRLLTRDWEIRELIEFGITDVVVDLRRGVNPYLDPVPKDKPKRALKKPEEDKPRPEPLDLEEIERRTGLREEEREDRYTLEEELPHVRNSFQTSAGAVRYFVDEVRKKRKMPTDLVNKVVDDVVDSVFRNRDAFMTLAKIKVYEKYNIAHPLLSSVIAVSFGRYLGMSRQQLTALGQAAILQDIGKSMVPRRILEKPGPLTPEEFETAKKHCLAGALMLKELPGATPLAIHTALHHHERYDGSGYPKGLRGDGIDPHLIISGLSDMFDALSADRVYKKGHTPHEALRIMFRLRGRMFPREWVDRFVHCLGIYPTGSVVELNTGEYAVVTAINHAQLLRPRVRIVTDGQGRPSVRVRHIDLNTFAHDHRSIVRAVPPETIGIDPAIFVDPDGVELP